MFSIANNYAALPASWASNQRERTGLGKLTQRIVVPMEDLVPSEAREAKLFVAREDFRDIGSTTMWNYRVLIHEYLWAEYRAALSLVHATGLLGPPTPNRVPSSVFDSDEQAMRYAMRVMVPYTVGPFQFVLDVSTSIRVAPDGRVHTSYLLLDNYDKLLSSSMTRVVCNHVRTNARFGTPDTLWHPIFDFSWVYLSLNGEPSSSTNRGRWHRWHGSFPRGAVTTVAISRWMETTNYV